MKLNPLFTVKENKLFKIDDNTQVDTATLTQIQIPWTTVEMEDEMYNEEFLATLRDQLKKMEDMKKFAVLIPVVDKPLDTPEAEELFINAFNHTARRIKDCISVVGFELPKELINFQNFIDTLAIKHEQYIYFTKAEKAPNCSIVMY